MHYIFLSRRPANVLLGFTGDAKLADFGLSRYCSLNSISYGGTTEYMAPELLNLAFAMRAGSLSSVFSDLGVHDLSAAVARTLSVKADVWSVGVLLYEVLSGSRAEVQAEFVLQNDHWVPPRLPEPYAIFSTILHLMLTRNPELRPDSATLLQHILTYRL